MDLQHQGRDRSGRHYYHSRLALFAAPALAAAALLINASLPTVAQSQINGRVTGAPVLAASHDNTVHVTTAKLPKAPVQVAMPAPPPMKIFAGLEEPLVATGPVKEEEGKALDAALKEFHDAPLRGAPDSDYADYAKPLLSFIEAHPASNWNMALYTDLGLGYYHAGYYSRAFDAFGKAWELGRNVNSSPQARLLVDRAVGELAKMHARVGHDRELDALLKEVVGKRPIGGPATELIQGAREGLWVFRNNPGMAYLCGPQALKNVLISLKAKPEQIALANDARSGPHGFSLAQVAQLADKVKLKYTLIERKPGQPIPVPSVINWKIHHYAAIVGKQGDFYQVLDPTFGNASGALLSERAIDEGSSGYFLVPAKARNAKGSWRTVSAKSDEAKAVYGMGTTSADTPGAMRPTDPKRDPSCPAPGAGSPIGVPLGATTTPQNCDAPQMTIANAHTMPVSLNLTDTPLGYRPQKGVPSLVQITYNQREDEQPATFGFSNLGSKWTHSWLAYIQDDPGTNREGWNVRHYVSGGGGYDYVNNYNRTTGYFIVENPDNSYLNRTPVLGVATTYRRSMPDGSQEFYTLSDGAATYPRKMFLTSVVDPRGNTTTLNYDGSLRLTSVVDAMGRSTTFTYGLSGFPLLVTQITDPFGRTTQLTYDTSQRLSSITDPAGITSSFTYSATEPTFINSLTTPYGTSTFSDAVNAHDTPETNTRALVTKDAMGFRDFLYFYQNPAITPSSDPACLLPLGMPTQGNGLLQWRNTYYWDRHAFAQGVTLDGSGNLLTEDFSKALLTHWVHNGSNANLTNTEPESIKPALERRIWFDYAGGAASYYNGVLDRPSFTGRVLDDNTTQLSSSVFNANGRPTQMTDPKGRSTKYTYATNNIDLLTVSQLTTAPSTYTTIATYGSYNTLHEPQTYTDAAGKVWNYTYNAAGQIATMTDPNSGVTTWNYDASGRLSTIVNANSQTVLTLTYDSADRVLTRTDSEGYTLTYAYDNLDRITSITYPDGTTDLYDYTFQSGPNIGTPSLDLRKHTDRLGRVTTYDFDADRRLTSVTEPTSGASTRTTSYSYYENNTLKDITDASGNVTHWDIDIESRPVAKTYGSGTANPQVESYTYEQSTSRLKAVTDALGQVKSYSYDLDDRPTGVAYSSIGTPGVSFAWDSFFPRLKSMTDGLGTTNYAYTAIGTNGALKLASIDGPFANDVIGLTYDALGRLAGRNITGGNETFGYDAISRLTTHGTPLGSFTNTYLGQTGQQASRSVTNGTVTVSTSWGYDTNVNDRRLISIANSGVTRSYTLGYGSTPVNPYDIMSITDTAATGHPFATQTHSYGYDLIDRLLSANQTTPGNNAYAYDPLDNATTVTDSTGTVNPTYNGFNQINTWGATNYSYDTKGNLLSDGTRNYKWDMENRLIEIDYASGAKSNFSYDGMGRRTVDVETPASGPAITTRFLWCGSRICQTRDGSDTVLSRILPEGEYTIATAQKAVYMPDQLGSVRDVLDATSGSLLSSIDFSPYGAPTATSGTFAPQYQYAGLFAHAQSGLLFSTTRAYDPAHPHWLNRDPIREWGGMNLYAYAGVNPINGIDPWGLIIIFTGDKNTQSALKRAYERVGSTPLGDQLENTLEQSDTTYTITNQRNNDAFFDSSTNTISVDPTYHPDMLVYDNKQCRLEPAPTDAILGHEIGHAATGTLDNGPGNMNNVNQNENPIRKALGEPPRLRY